MDKSVDDILRSHITIYDEMNSNKEKYIKQVDYLAFYCNQKARELYNPFTEYLYAERDNNNMIRTKRDNVYAMVEPDRIYLYYIETWKPVNILRRASYKDRRRIDIYWKGLRLYYNGYIQRLREYVKTYMWDMQRVDIARDTKTKYNEYVCDLWYNKNLEKKGKKIIVETNNERTYRTYGSKNSRMFVRIYDKTQDLKDGKNLYAWLYPERYKKECRRLEVKLQMEYAKAMTPLEWLDMIPCTKFIDPRKKYDKCTYKTTLLWMITLMDYCLPEYKDQVFVIQKAIERLSNKLKQINKFTWTNIDENERLPINNTNM